MVLKLRSRILDSHQYLFEYWSLTMSGLVSLLIREADQKLGRHYPIIPVWSHLGSLESDSWRIGLENMYFANFPHVTSCPSWLRTYGWCVNLDLLESQCPPWFWSRYSSFLIAYVLLFLHWFYVIGHIPSPPVLMGCFFPHIFPVLPSCSLIDHCDDQEGLQYVMVSDIYVITKTLGQLNLKLTWFFLIMPYQERVSMKI